jgi:hypothetical protein
MKPLHSILYLLSSNRIIRNIDLPSCKKCIYFIPSIHEPQTSDQHYSKCEKFGSKNIISDQIRHDYTDSCREDKTKCGKEGRFFKEEPNPILKIWKHNFGYYLRMASTNVYIVVSLSVAFFSVVYLA